jgi:hypothetical protein
MNTDSNSTTFFTTILIASMLSVLSVTAHSSETLGIVVLKSGEQFLFQGYFVDQGKQEIAFETVQGRRKIPFHKIRVILDSKRKDITRQVLDTIGAPDDGWQNVIGAEGQVTKKLAWTASVAIGGNYSFHAGNYYEGIDPGPGFHLDLALAISHSLALRAMISRAGMSIPRQELLVSLDPETSILSQQYEISCWRYVLALQYYSLLQSYPHTEDRSMFYIYAGLGAVVNQAKAYARVRNNTTNEIFEARAAPSETKTELRFGVGMQKMLSSNLGILGRADADILFLGESYDYRYVIPRKVELSGYIYDLGLSFVYII